MTWVLAQLQPLIVVCHQSGKPRAVLLLPPPESEEGRATYRRRQKKKKFRLAQPSFFFSGAEMAPLLLPPHRSLSRASAAGAIDRSGEDRRLCRRVFLTPPPPTSKRERVNVILFSYVFQQSALQIWLLLCKLGNLTLFLVCKRWGTKKKKTIDENGWWSLYPPQKTLYHVYDALLLKEPPLSFHFKTLFLGVILSLSLCYTHNWQVATFPGDNTDCFLCVYVFSFFQYLTKNPLFSLSFLSGGHKVVEDFNSF